MKFPLFWCPQGIGEYVALLKWISIFDPTFHQVYLVLEYVDGGELFDFIVKRGHLSEQVWPFFYVIFLPLKTVHSVCDGYDHKPHPFCKSPLWKAVCVDPPINFIIQMPANNAILEALVCHTFLSLLAVVCQIKFTLITGQFFFCAWMRFFHRNWWKEWVPAAPHSHFSNEPILAFFGASFENLQPCNLHKQTGDQFVLFG